MMQPLEPRYAALGSRSQTVESAGRAKEAAPFLGGDISRLARWLASSLNGPAGGARDHRFTPIAHLTWGVVGPPGLEPGTYGLKVRSSAN